MAQPDDRRPQQGPALIAAAIVLAAFIISWGTSRSEPRFQIAGSGTGFVRLDTDSGSMLACDMQRCRQIEAPLRAKTFGPLTVAFDDPEPNEAAQQKPQPKQLPPPKTP